MQITVRHGQKQAESTEASGLTLCSRVRRKVPATAYMDETGFSSTKEITIPEVALGDVNYSRVVDNKKYQNHLDQGMTNAFFR